MNDLEGLVGKGHVSLRTSLDNYVSNAKDFVVKNSATIKKAAIVGGSALMLYFFTSCSNGTAVATPIVLDPTKTETTVETVEVIETLEPTVEPTYTPTVTPDPNGDPDGDGYITYFEEIWGTNPEEFTSFEELSTHPGTIYAKMRVSQPFEFEDMNGTLYQVARMIDIEDNGTPDNPSDDHLNFEVVLFPYAQHIIDPTLLDELSYLDYVLEYLESTETSVISQEITDIMNKITAECTSDVESIEKIWNWNHTNLEVNEEWLTIPYSQIRRLNSETMFEIRKTRYSTSVATMMAAEIRSINIPTRIVQQVFAIECGDCSPNSLVSHPQNQVLLNTPSGLQWIILEYSPGQRGGVDPTRMDGSTPYYGLVMIDAFDDFMNSDFRSWEYVSNVLEGVVSPPDYTNWDLMVSSLVENLYFAGESTEN